MQTVSPERAQQPFSDQHHFTREQIEAAESIVSNEPPVKRLLIGATSGHRAFAIRQLVASQIALGVAVPSIFTAEWMEGTVGTATLWGWLVCAVAMWLLRSAMYVKLSRLLPEQLAGSVRMRIVPLAIALLAIVFWAVTNYLFVGPSLNSGILVLFAAYGAMSIAMAGVFLVSPISAGASIILLWGVLILRMWQIDLLSGADAWIVAALIFTMLALAVFGVSQLRLHLDRSDRVDLLLSDLRHANAQLENLRSALDADLRRKSAFFVSANHDFRQHLHGLKLAAGSADAAVRQSPLATGSAMSSIARLNEHVDALDHYVSNILDFARLETQREQPQLAAVALQEIFQDLAVDFEDVAQAAGRTIAIRSTRVTLQTDRAMLQRLLENLLGNAIKFTHAGVLVAARRQGGDLLVQVWDQGPGVDAAQQVSIFEAFHQADQATTALKAKRGIGLGLAIARRFAKSLGYSVSVRSWPGKGSVFEVRIPGSVVLS